MQNEKKNKTTVNFKLGKPSSSGERLILIHINLVNKIRSVKQGKEIAGFINNGDDVIINYEVELKEEYKPIIISSGLNCPQDFWNKKTKRADGKSFESLNKQLDLIEERLFSFFENLDLKKFTDSDTNEINNNNIKPLLKKAIQNGEQKKQEKKYGFESDKINPSTMTFHEYIKGVIKQIETYKEKDHTKKYWTFLNTNLEDYHTTRKIPPVLLCDLTTDYFEDVAKFWKQNKKWKLQHWSKQVDHLKKFYNNAINKDRLNLQAINWKIPLLKKRSEKTKDIALSPKQLQSIIDLNFSKEEKVKEICRDLFVVGCLTGGLRISDLKRLENVQTTTVKNQEVKFIESWSKKTNAYVKLPLFKPVLNIIKKYDGKIPQLPVSEQNFRWNIQTIGELAGLDSKVYFSYIDLKTNNQIEKPEMKLFYEMIKTKTARKTFCTLMVRHYKIDPVVVMAFSGHDKLSSLQHYIEETGDNTLFNDFAALTLKDKTFK